jgi:ubiquinone biosynthesis accessory factor UbiK
MADPQDRQSKFEDLAADLARRLAEMVPEELSGRARGLRDDMEQNFRGLLSGAVEKMDLVTREEFDAQREVLERTEEKLLALAERLAELEVGSAERKD